MRHIESTRGLRLPVLGLGTWRLGEAAARREAEVAALRAAIEMGYRLIDTAEMYGEGGAETVVGRALAEALRAGTVRRDELIVVSKVYPHNASRRGTQAACDRSRRRLGLDRIDLYLLHWRGTHPLAETVAAFDALVATGAIGHWGVSNFDVADLDALGDAAARCATNQIYYSITERGPELGVLPWMQQRAMPSMAYSPIDQGSLATDDTLAAIGAARGLTAAQIALAWVCSQPGMTAIPKASSTLHLAENLAAEGVVLSEAERQHIEVRFPRPGRKVPLAMR